VRFVIDESARKGVVVDEHGGRVSPHLLATDRRRCSNEFAEMSARSGSRSSSSIEHRAILTRFHMDALSIDERGRIKRAKRATDAIAINDQRSTIGREDGREMFRASLTRAMS